MKRLNRIYRYISQSVLILVLFSVSAFATTIVVTNLHDSGPGSLRQAIADAAPGDKINFGVTGTIILTSGQLVIDKNLTIQGPGQYSLAISGHHVSRVFYINSGVTSTLDGMTIRDGFAAGGATWYGGGIYNIGTLTISACTISQNGSEGYGSYGIGGGIYNDGTLSLNYSTVSGNISSDFDGNSDGGGICNFGAATINNSTFSGNVSNAGGGICNFGTMTVANSTISGNSVAWGGGGGGGAYYGGGSLTIINSTISANTAVDSAAGGITGNCWAGVCLGNESLMNTIVAGNSSPYGNDIWGTVETASHDLIGDAGSSGGMQNGVNGNIVGFDPLLGPLQNNGGPTLTHGLLAGSLAINSGDNCVLIENGCGFVHPALPTDQRGFLRIGNVDMGAFESGVWPCNSRRRLGFPVPNCG